MRALSLDVAPDAGVLSDGFRGERSCRRPPSTVRPGLPGETCTSESAGQARITPLSAADCSLATFEHCIYLVSPVGGTFQQLKDSARTDLEQAWDMFRGISADQFAEAMSSAMSPPDAAALNGPLAEYMASAIRDGLAPGVDGWWDDSRSSLIPWGFELAEVAVPVLVICAESRTDSTPLATAGRWWRTSPVPSRGS